VGLVYIALASDRGVIHKKFNFTGNRLEIKQQTAEAGLKIIIEFLKG